jgi:hypothetical protein
MRPSFDCQKTKEWQGGSNLWQVSPEGLAIYSPPRRPDPQQPERERNSHWQGLLELSVAISVTITGASTPHLIRYHHAKRIESGQVCPFCQTTTGMIALRSRMSHTGPFLHKKTFCSGPAPERLEQQSHRGMRLFIDSRICFLCTTRKLILHHLRSVPVGQFALRLALTTQSGSEWLSRETTSMDSICSYRLPGWTPV